MKKVIFVIGHLAFGGAERVVVTLANELSKNYKVTIIMISGNEVSYDLNSSIKVEELAVNKSSTKKLMFFINKIKLLRKRIKEASPNIVISFMSYVNLYTIAASLGLKSKIIVSERVFPKKTNINRAVKIVRNILYNFTDGLVFQTQAAADCFSNRIKLKSTIIGNPLKPNLPINTGVVRDKEIIAIGRLCEQKNYPLLIEAFKDVHERHRDYKLSIYGNGPLEKVLKIKYNALISKNIIEFKGYEKNIHEKILNARIFVLVSDYEGMPNALMEAMAIGLPSITTDSVGGGPKVLTQNGEYGILIEPGNSKILIEKIDLLIDDDDEFHRYSVNGSRFIRDNYDAKKIICNWVSYIEKIAS